MVSASINNLIQRIDSYIHEPMLPHDYVLGDDGFSSENKRR